MSSLHLIAAFSKKTSEKVTTVWLNQTEAIMAHWLKKTPRRILSGEDERFGSLSANPCKSSGENITKKPLND